MSDYCVGNCLSWDAVSGNLTIQEDPLGGLQCTPTGQSIRVAGHKTAVAVSAQNNGLFMTAAGELGTLVTPTMKTLQIQAASASLNAEISPGQGPFGYAVTAPMTFANPSPVYPMLVVLQVSYTYQFQLRGDGGSGGIYIQVILTTNGSQSVLDTPAYTFSNSIAVHMDMSNNWGSMRYATVAPGATSTFSIQQNWNTFGGTVNQHFSNAYCYLQAFGLIMPQVA